MKNLQLHPLCTLFPRMSGEEFEAFKEDIKTNGQRDPIVLHKGMILDGGNRYRALIDLGIEPEFENYDGEDIVMYVLSANLHRRHLTVGQQAAIVASMQDWGKAHPQGRTKSGNTTGLDTVAKRAAISGASDKTQRVADSLAKTNPEAARKVATGEMSLAEAAGKKKTTVAAPIPAPEQPEAFDPRQHEIDELKTTVAELSEENDQLRDAIAVGRLSEAQQPSAAEILAALRAKIKTLEATNAALSSARDGMMTEISELKRQCAAQRKEISKLKGE